jgi:hypothetical protein
MPLVISMNFFIIYKYINLWVLQDSNLWPTA